VWVILRRHIANALELAAANAHDRHPDFIMEARMKGTRMVALNQNPEQKARDNIDAI
jgi:hypothetical protein